MYVWYMNVGVWVCATVCIPTEAREEDNPLLLSTSQFETGSLTEQKAGWSFQLSCQARKPLRSVCLKYFSHA